MYVNVNIFCNLLRVREEERRKNPFSRSNVFLSDKDVYVISCSALQVGMYLYIASSGNSVSFRKEAYLRGSLQGEADEPSSHCPLTA